MPIPVTPFVIIALLVIPVTGIAGTKSNFSYPSVSSPISSISSSILLDFDVLVRWDCFGS
jgi:hypothetical protein